GGHTDSLLPAWKRVERAKATAAAVKTVVKVPDGFIGPDTPRTTGAQFSATNLGSEWSIRRPEGAVRIIDLCCGDCVEIARGVEVRLALGGHLLENLVSGCARPAAPAPGSAQLASEIVRRHSIKNVVGETKRPGLI